MTKTANVNKSQNYSQCNIFELNFKKNYASDWLIYLFFYYCNSFLLTNLMRCKKLFNFGLMVSKFCGKYGNYKRANKINKIVQELKCYEQKKY